MLEGGAVEMKLRRDFFIKLSAIGMVLAFAVMIAGILPSKTCHAADRMMFRECKIVCVKSNCADLFYAPYWGKQLKGWISNGKT